MIEPSSLVAFVLDTYAPPTTTEPSAETPEAEVQALPALGTTPGTDIFCVVDFAVLFVIYRCNYSHALLRGTGR